MLWLRIREPHGLTQEPVARALILSHFSSTSSAMVCAGFRWLTSLVVRVKVLNEKAGIVWSDIQPVALAPADATAAFAQGSVDAWSIWDPYLALAELKGDARVLVFAKEVHQPNAFVIA